MITQDLGIATAYGYAKSKGYTGTEAEFAELMASYASTAQTAIEAADRAVEANTAAQSAKTDAAASKTAAQTAAQTATSKASEAVTAAGTATTKASEASQSATSASQSAESAGTSAQTATTAATTATTKASEASESAVTATTAKTDAETARDAAAQSASEAAASAESIDPEALEHKAYGAYVVESASGAIASFPDGADSIPMKDVLVHIEPVQEGSGDPSPENVRPIAGWTGVQIWDDPKYGRLINWNQKLKNPHFDEGTNGLQYWVSSNVSVSNLEDGSVLLTITAVHETQSYYNLFKQDLATITTKQHKFLILWDYKPAHTHDVAIFLIRSPGGSENYGQTINDVSAGKWNRLAYFIPAQDRTFQQLQFALNATVNSGYSVGDVDYIRYPQMFDLTEMFGAGNEPTTLDEFKALFPKDCYDYNSEVTCVSAVSGEPHTHVQVSWQSEAGTIYGGTLDVTKGKLVVDRAIWTGNTADMNNNEDYPGWKNAEITDIIGSGVNQGLCNAISNISPAITSGSFAIGAKTNATSYATGTLWLNKDYFNKSQTEWKALAIDIQILLPLATPITYQLTPQEITSLLGENNVWADTGNTEVEYRASTKMYIDKKITEVVSALS